MSLSRKERQQMQREERAGFSHQEQPQDAPSKKKSRLWLYTGMGIAALLLIAISASAYYWLTPGPYDKFADCLKGKGAVMYGAMGWCKYTQGQKAMFGKSFKFIDYHEFTEYPKEYGEIKKTPTWIIGGKVYENAQSFEELSRVTGCPLS